MDTYRFSGLFWKLEYDKWDNCIGVVGLCPKKQCRLPVEKYTKEFVLGKYKYKCIGCDHIITLDTSIDIIGSKFLKIYKYLDCRDANIVNVDGELIPVSKASYSDNEHWIDIKVSINKKGEKQAMILIGAKNMKDKTQLFLDINHEKISFDQNNLHPIYLLSKVLATFSNSSSEISSLK